MNCGSSISEGCAGATFDLSRIDGTGELCSVAYESTETQNWCIVGRWFDMFGEIKYVSQFMIVFILMYMTDGLSVNMKRGMNALRCMFSSSGDNFAYGAAALYFAARQFGQEGEIQTLVNDYWPYACTCIQDVDNMAEWAGIDSETSD